VTVYDISITDISKPEGIALKNLLPHDLQQLIPLSPALFFVLLTLTDGDSHGYAIMKQIGSLSNHAIRMGPATLYTSLQRLLELGLIEEVAGRATEAEGDRRRRYYRLSRNGRLVLEAEVGRMDSLVRLAKMKTLAPRTTE
jgi:DNA-binding PadR family transcriptional regulator